MKKIMLLSLLLFGVAGITAHQADAYSESRDGTGCRIAGTFCAISESEDKLDQAIQLRNRYYNYTFRINNGDRKSVPHQQWRHRIGRSLINVDQRSTVADREGELKDVPYYEDRRSVNKNNFRVSNNAKVNWRRAAINYYVDGGHGYTSPEGMNEGVIHLKRDNHQVRRAPVWQLTQGATSKSDIRRAQKIEASIADNEVNKAPTGSPLATPFKGRSGAFRRNYYTPYTQYEVYNPNSYLRTDKAIFGETPEPEDEALMESTEAE